MNKYSYSREQKALLPLPMVEEPFIIPDIQCKCESCMELRNDQELHNTWKSGILPVVGEVEWKDGDEKVEGVDFTKMWQNRDGDVGETFAMVALYDESTNQYDAWLVAVPYPERGITISPKEKEAERDLEAIQVWLTPKIDEILKLHDKFLISFPDHEDEEDNDLKLCIRAGITDIIREIAPSWTPEKGNPKEQVYSEAEVRELLRQQREVCAKMAKDIIPKVMNSPMNVSFVTGRIISAPTPQLKSSLNQQP